MGEAKRKRRRRVRAHSPEAIKKRNEAFAKLPPHKKRVVVAKDVIAALDANQYIAQTGHYVNNFKFSPLESATRGIERFTDEWYERRGKTRDVDAQVALLKGQVSCNVCAIGGVFMCAVERMDKIQLNELERGRSRMVDYLDGMFSAEQLDLMEIAFEGSLEHAQSERYKPSVFDEERGYARRSFEYASAEASAEVGAARDFYFDHAGDEEDPDEPEDNETAAAARMRAIMKNIIANGGEFKP